MPWVQIPIWHGSLEDAHQLIAAVFNNCPQHGGCNGQCGGHQAMLEQRFIDGILFGRFMRERLLREEGLG